MKRIILIALLALVAPGCAVIQRVSPPPTSPPTFPCADPDAPFCGECPPGEEGTPGACPEDPCAGGGPASGTPGPAITDPSSPNYDPDWEENYEEVWC